MSLTYGFYNSYNHDRLYDAIQFGSIFDGVINDGVFMSIGERFMVTSVEDSLSLQVGTGRAWFFHTWSLLDAPLIIDLPAAELLTDRIDIVVLEVNYETRENSVKIVKGTGAVVPEKPIFIWTDKIHQYPLAYYTIKANQTYVPQEQIENAVGLTDTPFVTGIIESVSVERLVIQWEAQWKNIRDGYKRDFEKWFRDLKTLLDGDVAANLTSYVLDLRDRWRLLHRKHITIEPVLDENNYIVLDDEGYPLDGVVRYSTYYESVNTDFREWTEDGTVYDIDESTISASFYQELYLKGIDEKDPEDQNAYVGVYVSVENTGTSNSYVELDAEQFVVNVYGWRDTTPTMSKELINSVTLNYFDKRYANILRLNTVTIQCRDRYGNVIDGVTVPITYSANNKTIGTYNTFTKINDTDASVIYDIAGIMAYKKPSA